ncbi:MAG: radical SAM protein [Lachnospiraceae bacterium]|nr:radical SAM protein [Lachnospiraceae bacterium]
MYQPFFATVYAEKDVWNPVWQTRLSTRPILIDHYKDIFNRSHQDFSAQKKAPSLILAKKTGTLIYKGAPVCQSFGNEHFYYTSCMMNCIYHCEYCYLQGMYPSGHVVAFVNLEDYFNELELLLAQHPVYLCVSYDTDLLALEPLFGFVASWLSFAATHPDLTLEIRTKSGNPAVFEPLAVLFQNKEQLKRQIIFAWTLSPEALCTSTEHGAASLPLRLKALQAAKASGFSVRLCFDPMIYHAGWEEEYSTLVDNIFSKISADSLYDVSIGVFRISTDYLKNMRKKRPDSAIVQYPYITENGVSHYGTLSEKMVQYMQELLLPHVPAEKIFVWNGENEE